MLDFLTDDHRMISDAVGAVIAGLRGQDADTRLRSEQRIAPAAVRRSLAEIGVVGPLDRDGPMATALGQALVVFEAGKAALPYPLVEELSSQLVLAHGLTSEGGFPDFGDGTITRPMLAQASHALPTIDGGRIFGRVRAVPFADIADRVLVPARRSDETIIVAVDLAASGVERIPGRSIEQSYPVFDLRLTDVSVDPQGIVAGTDSGFTPSETFDLSSALLAAAEIAGAGTQVIDMTREYLSTRVQFGKPLGANQVLKHRLAESYVAIEALWMAVRYAAAAFDAASEDAAEAVIAAKLFAGESGRELAEAALQLHGAIGYTMEFPLHFYMRRMLSLTEAHGSTYIQGERLYRQFEMMR